MSDVLGLLRAIHCRPDDPRWAEVLADTTRIKVEFLRDLAERCEPAKRWKTLSLAASLATSADTALEKMTRETFASGAIPRDEFVRYLMALASFRGDSFWGSQLSELIDENVIGRCPHCANEAIVPADPSNPVTSGAAFLHDEAMRAGEDRIAAAMMALFDEGSCPKCGQRFGIKPVER